MLKKSFIALALGALFINSALADEDILALITKGKITSATKGVQVLSLEEKKEVKGGIRVDPYRGGQIIDNAGNKIFLYGYYVFSLEDHERDRGIIALDSRESISRRAQNYLDFKWLTALDPRNERVMMFVKYDYATRQYHTEILAYDLRYHTQRKLNQGMPIIEKLNGAREHNIRHLSKYR